MTTPAPPRRSLSQRLAYPIRWLHIYLSMFGFVTILFFSVTGVTLNHPTWFGMDATSEALLEGQMDLEWLQPTQSIGDSQTNSAGGTEDAGTALEDDVRVNELAIVEFLRSTHHVQGAVREIRTDEFEVSVAFASPGYSAEAVIDRESGNYQGLIVSHGTVAIMNDLHKGRDSGAAWSVVIDVSAVLMAVSSLTGLFLLLYLRRKRASGLWTGIVGGVVLAAVYLLMVP